MTLTNGASPLDLEIPPVTLGEGWDGVISYFYRQPFHHRLCINDGVFARGEAPSAVVVFLPGLVTVFRIPHSGRICSR